MLTVERLVALTRERLGARERRVVAGGPLVKAAVLVPIVDRGEPFLVFAKRTEHVGTHRGQISFPGGRLDPSDRGLLEAALRESEEEIGLPRSAVTLQGALPPVGTFVTGYRIFPFVGTIERPAELFPQEAEVARSSSSRCPTWPPATR